jgi:uncharacterized protein (TIGR03437 family)
MAMLGIFALGLALNLKQVSARWKKDNEPARSANPGTAATVQQRARRTLVMTAAAVQASVPVSTVSAASFEGFVVAPDSIVSSFGESLATQTLVASDIDPSTPGIQLPTQLAGTTVEVNNRRAGLFFVSPGQINYVLPAATETGTANIVVKSGGGTTSTGSVQVVRTVPSIFTANADGKGVPAATLLRVKASGQQTYEAIAQFSSTDNKFIPKPIDMGPDTDRVFLILYLTGVRNAGSAANVRLMIGGEELSPSGLAPQPDFVGLDQINVELPRTLIGKGALRLSVTPKDSTSSDPNLQFSASNPVDIEIAGTTGAAPPKVNGWDSAALAGTELIINGSGFSTAPGGNQVRIGSLDVDDIVNQLPNQLKIMVPFGVSSGPVSVRTAQGQGTSSDSLPVRTSISGYVENTSRLPLQGVNVSVQGTSISTKTNEDGSFVLPDVPTAIQFVNVDGGAVGSNPPYPKIQLKIAAQNNRDNQFTRAISLQQATGSGGTVGTGAIAGMTGENGTEASLAEAAPIVIQTGDYRLDVNNATSARFPTGETVGTLTLTPLKDARTPVELPLGFFSSAIVQITPFKVKLNPGAQLTFPNTDGFSAGTPASLFRFDHEEGRFVEDKSVRASVSADGKFIQTDLGAIRETSLYFAAILRPTTTITGRVVEKADGKTPVMRATVSFRGAQAVTDSLGGYILRFVPVKERENISVEASVLRASGRVDRTTSAVVPAVIGGTTKMIPIIMPGVADNRPPTILVQQDVRVDEGKTLDIPVFISDPDVGQTVNVRAQVPSFVGFTRAVSSNSAAAFNLSIKPNFSQAGKYRITIIATDNLSQSATETIDLVVNDVNRPPIAKEIGVVIDEDGQANIVLDGSDPDGDRVSYSLVGQPASGTISGTAPNLVYKPNLNFNGIDRFSYKVNDGKVDGNTAIVIITVNPVNDAPIISVPGPQTVDAGKELSFAVTASDIDNPTGVIITATGMPNGATLTPVAGTTPAAQFKWTPEATAVGVYTITFKVTDPGNPPLSDSKQVTITVKQVPVTGGEPVIKIIRN